MNDNEVALEKIKLKTRIEMMEGFVEYLLVDNEIVDASPILKPKAKKLLEQLSDFKNHVV